MCALRLIKRTDSIKRQSVNISQLTIQSKQLSNDTNQSRVKPFKDIPGPKGLHDLPYIGTALHFKPFTKYVPGDVLEIVKMYKDKYGDICKFRVGKDHLVYIFHPDYAKSVLLAHYKKHYRDAFDLMNVFDERNDLPKHLTCLQGEEWAAVRKPIQEKMLRPSVVASYIPMIDKIAGDLTEMWKNTNGKVEDLQKDLSNYSTENLGMLCFNKRLNCLDDKTNAEFIRNMQILFDSIQQTFFMPVKTYRYFRTKFYQTYEENALKFYKFARNKLHDQKKFLQEMKATGKLYQYLQKEPNFMHSVITDNRISDDIVNGLVMDLFGAGIDSVPNSMVFLLTDLALNADKQEILFNEIKDIVGKTRHLTKEHINQLSYLKACVKESQRKTYPIMIGSKRILESDLVVGGYELPKNTNIGLCQSIMCKDDRFFPRPDEYIPERWLRTTNDPIATGQNYSFVVMPFGYGPRSCIGQRFAELEIYIGVTKIIQNFRIFLPQNITEVKSVNRLFTKPRENVMLHLVERTDMLK